MAAQSDILVNSSDWFIDCGHASLSFFSWRIVPLRLTREAGKLNSCSNIVYLCRFSLLFALTCVFQFVPTKQYVVCVCFMI